MKLLNRNWLNGTILSRLACGVHPLDWFLCDPLSKKVSGKCSISPGCWVSCEAALLCQHSTASPPPGRKKSSNGSILETGGVKAKRVERSAHEEKKGFCCASSSSSASLLLFTVFFKAPTLGSLGWQTLMLAGWAHRPSAEGPTHGSCQEKRG